MIKISPYLTVFVFFLSFQNSLVYSRPANKASDCAEVSAEIQTRKETLIHMNASLEINISLGLMKSREFEFLQSLNT